MKRVLIADTATVTSLGVDTDTLWQNLMKKKTAIKPVQRFKTENYISPYGALIESLSDTENSSMIFTLADLLIEQLSDIPKDSYLFIASTKSGIDVLEKNNKGQNVPNSQLVMSNLAEYISKKLELIDNGVIVSSACASSTIAVAKGAALISSGRAQSVLICCLDVISEFIFSGFSALQAMSPKPSKPFDIERKGLTLGEGAAAILLMSEDKLEKENKTKTAELAGWGIANDAAHITAPARDGCGLKIAVSQAISKAEITPDDIDAFSSHGTGTVYNDLMELRVIRDIFNNRDLPTNSIKGSVGHTLGASGGIEIVLGAKMLDEGIVPATVGLTNPEKEAVGIVSPENQNFSGKYLISTNSGFGGTNAAVIIKRSYI